MIVKCFLSVVNKMDAHCVNVKIYDLCQNNYGLVLSVHKALICLEINYFWYCAHLFNLIKNLKSDNNW